MHRLPGLHVGLPCRLADPLHHFTCNRSRHEEEELKVQGEGRLPVRLFGQREVVRRRILNSRRFAAADFAERSGAEFFKFSRAKIFGANFSRAKLPVAGFRRPPPEHEAPVEGVGDGLSVVASRHVHTINSGQHN